MATLDNDFQVPSGDDEGATLTNEQILDKYSDELGGTKFAENGDLVDDAGTVIKSKADYDQFLVSKKVTVKPVDSNDDNDDAETTIEINGEMYDLDEQGNAIKDNQIAFTAEQLKAASEANDDDEGATDLAAVMELTGFKPTDEKGNPIVYEQTVEGIAKYATDLAEYKYKAGVIEQANAYFKANPDILEAHMYKRQHGNLNGFGSVEDWSKIEVDPANIDQHVDLIIKAKMAEGLNANDSKRFAEFIKASGETTEEAKVALEALKIAKANNDKLAAEDLKRETDARLTAEAAYKNDVVTLIKGGKLDDIQIPETMKVTEDGKVVTKTRDDFMNYFLQPAFEDEQGKQYTAYEADMKTKGTVGKLKHAYIEFMKGDLSQLVKAGVRKEQVTGVRKLVIGKGKGTVSKGVNDNRSVIL